MLFNHVNGKCQNKVVENLSRLRPGLQKKLSVLPKLSKITNSYTIEI